MSVALCRHPGCRCGSRPEFDGYCSVHCASAGLARPPTGGCQCGHPACVPITFACAGAR